MARMKVWPRNMSKHRSEAYKARRRKGGALYHVTLAKLRRKLARMTDEQRAKRRRYGRQYYKSNRTIILLKLRDGERRRYYLANREALLAKARARCALLPSKPPKPPRPLLSPEEKRARRRAEYLQRRALHAERMRQENKKSYYKNHARNLAARRRRRREQSAARRFSEIIRKRAYAAETQERIRQRNKKQQWIAARLVALAKQDGMYDLLGEQFYMADNLYDKLLADLVRAKDAGDNYKSVKDELWATVLTDKDRYLTMFFANWFNNNWARDTAIKPYKERAKPTPQELKQRRKSDSNLRGIALMNMFLSDGETRLKDATGAQIKLEGGWFLLIAKHVKPTEIVGRKLTAQQLFNLRIQAEPNDKGRAA